MWISRKRALWPTSTLMVGTTGTKNPMSRLRQISRPGNSRTCPWQLVEMLVRTSNGMVEPKSVLASPSQEILPLDKIPRDVIWMDDDLTPRSRKRRTNNCRSPFRRQQLFHRSSWVKTRSSKCMSNWLGNRGPPVWECSRLKVMCSMFNRPDDRWRLGKMTLPKSSSASVQRCPRRSCAMNRLRLGLAEMVRSSGSSAARRPMMPLRAFSVSMAMAPPSEMVRRSRGPCTVVATAAPTEAALPSTFGIGIAIAAAADDAAPT
mmetsp:Transcript_26435/g.73952  ORF Transcript_26435/g.73952 Transcript_26435/m.73952 type:complete len:262 (+) Transcript_26435:486-1271(+)